ncbi:MAG TPA: DNA polymerase III subunit delta [Caldilineae bacterium]|nr:DNA polymerase III subunit delta [Caldilineae bacterium]
MIYVFHGDEEFAKSERIAALRTELGEFADISTTELDGRSTTRQELQHHCDVPPFLGDYRLVIVSNLLTRLAGSKSKGGAKAGASADYITWLVDYLPTVPESTQLVFSEDKKLPKSHPVLKAVAKLGERSEITVFSAPTPKGRELARWVEKRAQKRGVKLAGGVADDLASFIGSDLRLIDSELEKLAVYVGDRPVRPADVRLLVPYAQDASIFDMVDALGHRRTAQAFRLLAQLRNEGAHPLYLLTMIVRQYRILLQVKELMQHGLDRDAIAKKIRLHPFPTKKAMAQARQYSPQQLNSIYDRLLDTDVAIKTGRMEANLALDILVVELARA